MKVYLDTSALVKFFHEEEGTDLITALIEDSSAVLYVSELTILEFTSALQRLCRAGFIDRNNLKVALDSFRKELSRFKVIPVNSQVINGAEKLLLELGNDPGLRTLDSIQLSTFISLNLNLAGGLFVASDLTLVKAAEAKGIKTYNPVWDNL
jgi:uncharacterized protein